MKNGLANVNDTTLYYEVAGEGSPLVLISGGGVLDRRAWDEQFIAFAEFYQVIRYDIRGMGKSARPLAPFSHSKDLHDLLTCLDTKRAHMVGLSFGGAIAIDFALEYPDMVDRLILAATGTSSDAKGEANLQTIAALSAMARTNGVASVIQLIVNTRSFISSDNAAMRETVRQIYVDNRAMFESDFDLVRLWQPTEPPASERLSEIRAPVLLLEGTLDTPESNAMTDNLLKITGARKMVIPSAGHAINLDNPKAFNKAVLAFLDN